MNYEVFKNEDELPGKDRHYVIECDEQDMSILKITPKIGIFSDPNGEIQYIFMDEVLTTDYKSDIPTDAPLYVNSDSVNLFEYVLENSGKLVDIADNPEAQIAALDEMENDARLQRELDSEFNGDDYSEEE